MKITKYLLALLFALVALTNYGQTSFKDLKVGHVFYISIPDYMSKTTGLNTSASIQFKSVVKDVYGFIIEDSKEDLKLAETNFSSINEYYDFFIKDFLKDEDKRSISTPNSFKKGQNNYLEIDASYFDKDAKIDIYYYVCVVETKDSYYKVLCWSSLENKDKFKADFQKIAYSLRD